MEAQQHQRKIAYEEEQHQKKLAEKQAKHYYEDQDRQMMEEPDWYAELIPESLKSARQHSTPIVESRPLP